MIIILGLILEKENKSLTKPSDNSFELIVILIQN